MVVASRQAHLAAGQPGNLDVNLEARSFIASKAFRGIHRIPLTCFGLT